jgi:hypothetical protein
LENEQKFKVDLQVRKNENNGVLAKLQITKEKINMEKHNKDMENMKINKDSLQAIMK